MAEPIFNASQVRGVIGETMTPDWAARCAAAFVGALPTGPVIVGRDGRASGVVLAEAVRAAVRATGHEVFDVGIAATPTIGVLVRMRHAVAGIQVSASHHPPEFNGLLLLDQQGRALTAERSAPVWERSRSGPITWAPHDRLGGSDTLAITIAEHADLVLSTVNLDRIRARRFRVLLDANRGAGSVLGRHLLQQRLGCTLILVGGDPDGRFEHAPEPVAANLGGVAARVKASNADVGFCLDPDADQLTVIDERGRHLGQDYTLALCLDHVLRQHRGPVVACCATSRMCEDVARKYDAPFVRTAAGEAPVVERMVAENAIFGGEGRGAPIDPRVGWVRDAFVGMVLILDAMADRQQPASQLADSLPAYAMHRTRVPLAAETLDAAAAAVDRHFSGALRSESDGVRFDWPNRWLLVRPCRHAPGLRLLAEAPTAAEAQQLCAEAEEACRAAGA